MLNILLTILLFIIVVVAVAAAATFFWAIGKAVSIEYKKQQKNQKK